MLLPPPSSASTREGHRCPFARNFCGIHLPHGKEDTSTTTERYHGAQGERTTGRVQPAILQTKHRRTGGLSACRAHLVAQRRKYRERIASRRDKPPEDTPVSDYED